MSQQSDLISVTMVLCRDLCDMAHVLSRMTTMPVPNDEVHKEAIKGGIDALYKKVMMSRAQLCALSDIANFDATEIKPNGNLPDATREKIDRITGFLRGENDLDEETKKEVEEIIDVALNATDMPEEEKKEAKTGVSDMLQQLADRRKKKEDEEDGDNEG